MKYRTLIGLSALGLCGALAQAQTPQSYFVVNLGNPLGRTGVIGLRHQR
jgi:hypothetical protein